MRRLVQPWQGRAYSYYDVIPEIKYAAQFYARALSVLRLYAAKMNRETGDYEEIEDQNDPAVKQLERIQDPGGGRSGLLSSYGRLMFLGGEAYLLVTRDEDTEDEQWEILSPDELRIQAGIYTRFKAPSLPPEQMREPPDDAYSPMSDDEAVVYRLWRRHPRYSMLADSTMQGVLDVCEELVLLTQAVRARARSRLAGPGILLVNGKIIPLPVGGDTADEDAEEDPFVRDLVEAMTTPIMDEGTAAAVVPLVVRIDTEKIDEAMKHIQILDPTQLYPETGLRRECVERLAVGLDMPPEVLLGLGDANHWSAWQVDEQTWKGHLQPVAQTFCDDLTSAFFRPTLKDEGLADWREYVIGYDASMVVNHPDRSADAKDLHDRGALSDAGLREASGFDEDDAPSQEETWRYLGIKTRDSSLAVYGIPSIKTGGLEPQAGEIQQGDGTAPTADGSGDVTKGPPPGDGSEPVVASAQVAKVVGACDLALHRARELAGARLRNLAKRDKELAALLDGVTNGQVAPTLGRDRVAALKAPSERELVAGSGVLIADSLRLWKMNADLAPGLADRIEQHAARTLYEKHPSPLPQSFENYVQGLNGHLKEGAVA
jgi:hypothetical protein